MSKVQRAADQLQACWLWSFLAVTAPQLHPTCPGRKRQRQAQDTLESADKPVLKRARLYDAAEKSRQEFDSTNPIAHWAREGRWPSHFIAQKPNMNRILARKKSSSSLRSRKRSEPGSASSATPSDQKPRETKSAPYRDPRYKKLLEAGGSFRVCPWCRRWEWRYDP